jgi:hypothetical protein
MDEQHDRARIRGPIVGHPTQTSPAVTHHVGLVAAVAAGAAITVAALLASNTTAGGAATTPSTVPTAAACDATTTTTPASVAVSTPDYRLPDPSVQPRFRNIPRAV